MSNKDYNYIAAVEKAIADKYGKNTVQDFRNEWEDSKEHEYLRQLKERNRKRSSHQHNTSEELRGNVIVKKPTKESSADRTCPVCKTYSFSTKDDLYMNRFQACFECYLDFIESRESRWKEGWRPDQERMEHALRRRK
tara:strand:+ start:183 stop:596 length:414 start_codon:yes stop_codon:yes gene_type:complete